MTKQNMLDQRLLESWFTTVNDLRIEVVTPTRVWRIHDSVKNRIYYLKRKNSQEEVERELYLGTILSPQHFSSIPVMSRTGEFAVSFKNEVYCMYKGLAGQVAKELFSPAQAYLFGKAIATLHTELLNVDVSYLKISEMNLQKQLTDWAIPLTLEFSKDEARVQTMIELFYNEFFPLLHQLPYQTIHRDAHPKNMLFHHDQLSGFIDFDLLTQGIRIFDLCYCSTAILMEDFTNVRSRENWFCVLKELVRGYQSYIALSADEVHSVFPVLLSIQFIFVAYFNKSHPELASLNLEGLYWIFEHRQNIEEAL